MAMTGPMGLPPGMPAAIPAVPTTGFVVSDIPPKQTLYINNLNDRINRHFIKKALYAVFSPFGRVVEIDLVGSKKLRGQAWVTFADVASATNALRTMQGFMFFDKPMRIQFAKAKADVIAKQEGTWVPRDKKRKRTDSSEDEGGDVEVRKRGGAAGGAGVAAVPPPAPGTAGYVEPVLIPAPAPKVPSMPPNHVLLAQNLPPDTTADTLRGLFGQYAGLRDVRLVAERGLAFVEFENEALATPALQGLHNLRLGAAHVMQVTYAKK